MIGHSAIMFHLGAAAESSATPGKNTVHWSGVWLFGFFALVLCVSLGKNSKRKCYSFSVSGFSNVKICCFSPFYVIVNRIYSGFRLFVAKTRN